MSLKLTQTDHNEQSLRMDRETTYLVREAFGAMLDHQVGSIEMRERALQLKRMLEDPDREDRPALFQKTHGSMMLCPNCHGTGKQVKANIKQTDEVEFITCTTCQGEGSLYYEVIKKGYIPTEYHRKKLAR